MFKQLFAFALGGYGLVNWNVVLNTTQYFNNLALNKNFFTIFQFAYMAGSLISFLTARKIFSKASSYMFILVNMFASIGLMLIEVFFFKIFPQPIPSPLPSGVEGP